MQVPLLNPIGPSDPALTDSPVEAVLAASLALMTAHRLASSEQERFVLEDAIARSLERLLVDEGLSDSFKAIVSRLQLLWMAGGAAGADGEPVLH